ncbi:hypothetical protein H696_00356 [Fonticula alba]|uniref:Uncharacterized protein n=1 Tax=Fonticula alba TaxID=691883 RepID=A0A058ZH17_FONAL|nr:hypothetical protein H696_00356 [Fonticula alba]KCV72777.1 hypothetical protein H696_00356 [Fonticula alba]|eukprot:XP_009492478.1 hypothetical protein H696_00356 [Fonticula alba]
MGMTSEGSGGEGGGRREMASHMQAGIILLPVHPPARPAWAPLRVACRHAPPLRLFPPRDAHLDVVSCTLWRNTWLICRSACARTCDLPTIDGGRCRARARGPLC